MFSIEEVRYRSPPTYQRCSFGLIYKKRKRHTGIARIYLHGLKPLVSLQRRAGPFPDAAQSPLSGEGVAERGDGDRVPVFESDVVAAAVPTAAAIVEIREHWPRWE